jgi:hypothetical protein
LYGEVISNPDIKIIIGYGNNNLNYTGWKKILEEKRIERITKYLSSLGLSSDKIIEEWPKNLEGAPTPSSSDKIKVVLVQ